MHNFSPLNKGGNAATPPNFSAIAESGLPELAGRWCVWGYRERDGGGKPAKVPNGAKGQPLSVAKPDDWLTFNQAQAAFERGGFDGVGLLMSSAVGLVGLDLDMCLEADGTVTGGKEQIVAEFIGVGGYVEVSPSGRGLRQFVRGVTLDDFAENNGAGLEIYDADSSRYLTVTGQLFQPVGFRPIIANQSGLEALTLAWGKRRDIAGSGSVDGAGSVANRDGFPIVDRSVDEILAMMKQRNKRGAITKLLAGDISDHPGASEADAALAFDTVYYVRDPEIVEAVMRRSKLVRDKWDSKRGRGTYLSLTIENALKAQRRNYDVDQATREAKKAAKAEATEALEAKGEGYLIGGLAGLTLPGGRIRNDVFCASELLIRDTRLLGAIYWNLHAGCPMLTRPLSEALGDKAAPDTGGRFTDRHFLAVACWLSREWGVTLPPRAEVAVVVRWASVTQRNPLIERFDALKWDGVARLDSWLIDYAKAVTASDEGRDISAYVAAVGARWLISIVARSSCPGTKVDSMLVLESAQGMRKSSLFRVIGEAIDPASFREGFSVRGGKDDALALRGRCVVEWAELAGLSRRDANELKNFLTLQTDSYRDPYGIVEGDHPRTAVFGASTNDGSYLVDPTGNRRFWPVRLGGRVDIDGLRKAAEQLIAEAAHRYRAGERWWFDDADPRDAKILRLAEREQRNRLTLALWDDYAAELSERLVAGVLVDQDGNVARDDGAFSVFQMKAWIGLKAGGGVGDGAVNFDDSTWRAVTSGLRKAGWDCRKSHGRNVWFLTPERRDEMRSELDIVGGGVSARASTLAAEVASRAISAARSAP